MWCLLGQQQTPNMRNHKKSKALLLEQHFYLQWNKLLFVDWWTQFVQQIRSDPMLLFCTIVISWKTTAIFSGGDELVLSNDKHIFRWPFACFQTINYLAFVETQECSSRSGFPCNNSILIRQWRTFCHSIVSGMIHISLFQSKIYTQKNFIWIENIVFKIVDSVPRQIFTSFFRLNPFRQVWEADFS